jgi:hypothetical protein
MATNPVLLIKSITSCLASKSSPDVKMTVGSFFGEKSCIHSIGMLLQPDRKRRRTCLRTMSGQADILISGVDFGVVNGSLGIEKNLAESAFRARLEMTI